MQIFTINNYNDFHSKIDQLFNNKDQRGRYIFRGVSDAEYALVPKIGREEIWQCIANGTYNWNKVKNDTINITDVERFILEEFKSRAIPYIQNVFQPRVEIEWLALAQHHGLPTRLLDWTWNPLIAAFFALDKHFGKNCNREQDCAVYACNTADLKWITLDDIENAKKFNPFEKQSDADVYPFVPYHISERISAQSALFTIHLNPNKPYDGNGNLSKFIIPENAVDDIVTNIHRYGIDRAMLFPGLDGLCRHIEWLVYKYKGVIVNRGNYKWKYEK